MYLLYFVFFHLLIVFIGTAITTRNRSAYKHLRVLYPFRYYLFSEVVQEFGWWILLPVLVILQKKKRYKISIIRWFNCDISTKVGKKLFEALDRNFPEKHKYHRILNRQTIKLSYSTTPSLGRIIAGINGAKIRNKDRLKDLWL